MSTEIENIFVDILLPKTKLILIGNVYRPPDQSGFPDKISNAILNTPNFDSQEVYILGDLNINLNYTGRRVPNGVKKYREFVHCTDSHSWQNHLQELQKIHHIRSYTYKLYR